MHISVICIGKLKERWWCEAQAEYAKRLSRFCTLRIVELKEERLSDRAQKAEEAQVIAAESKALLRAVRPGSYLVALAVKGKALSSEQLAEKIDSLALLGQSDISFLIGGSLGLSEEALLAADLQLSFSAMTFPHQMMRVILLEQIYRACKINTGETYHK